MINAYRTSIKPPPPPPADYVLDDLVSNGELEPGSRDKVRDALLQKHKHLSTKDHHHESRLFGHIR